MTWVKEQNLYVCVCYFRNVNYTLYETTNCKLFEILGNKPISKVKVKNLLIDRTLLGLRPRAYSIFYSPDPGWNQGISIAINSRLLPFLCVCVHKAGKFTHRLPVEEGMGVRVWAREEERLTLTSSVRCSGAPW